MKTLQIDIAPHDGSDVVWNWEQVTHMTEELRPDHDVFRTRVHFTNCTSVVVISPIEALTEEWKQKCGDIE